MHAPAALVTAPAPTVAHPTSVPAPVAPHVVPHSVHALAGTGSGTYVCNLKMGSTPTGFYFDGTAMIQGMGLVHIAASIRGVGFTAGGQATGRITFTNASGSVTVQLTGAPQPALSPLPSDFHYRVIGGTGAYLNLKDEGQLKLIRTADAVPVRFGIQYIETGSFRIAIP
jgi:hypothetical protein